MRIGSPPPHASCRILERVGFELYFNFYVAIISLPGVRDPPRPVGRRSACAVGASDKEVFVGQRGKTSPSIIVLDAKTGNYSRGFGPSSQTPPLGPCGAHS